MLLMEHIWRVGENLNISSVVMFIRMCIEQPIVQLRKVFALLTHIFGIQIFLELLENLSLKIILDPLLVVFVVLSFTKKKKKTKWQHHASISHYSLFFSFLFPVIFFSSFSSSSFSQRCINQVHIKYPWRLTNKLLTTRKEKSNVTEYLHRQCHTKSGIYIQYYTWISIPLKLQLQGNTITSIFNNRYS